MLTAVILNNAVGLSIIKTENIKWTHNQHSLDELEH